MDVKKFYESINGNYQTALGIMMNDAFIAKLLGKFVANNSYNDIIADYEKKDFEALFAAVHSFKGVAGNLSLTPLFDIACVITEATRSLEPVNIDKEIDQLKKDYLLVIDSYNKYIL